MSINSNAPSTTTVHANMQSIMDVVNDEVNQMTLLSCNEGEVATNLSGTQTLVAENYKSALDDYVEASRHQQTAAIALTAVSGAVSGFGGVGAGVGVAASSTIMNSIGHTLCEAAQMVVAPLAEAGSNIAHGVLSVQVGKDEAHEELYSSVNEMLGSTTGDAVDSIGSVIETKTAIAGALHTILQSEAQAGEYPAY